jgi:hypothetical protein
LRPYTFKQPESSDSPGKKTAHFRMTRFPHALSARPPASQGFATAGAARKRRNSISGKNRPSEAKGVCTSRQGRTPGWAKSGHQRGAKSQYRSGPNDNIKGGPDLVDKHTGQEAAFPSPPRYSIVGPCESSTYARFTQPAGRPSSNRLPYPFGEYTRPPAPRFSPYFASAVLVAGRRGPAMSSTSLALPKMMGKSPDQVLRCNVEGFADSQQGEYCSRASGLNHLPMADAEPVRDHVLLGQLPLQPAGPDAMPQGAEIPCITGRKIPAGSHIFKTAGLRARRPRTKMRIVLRQTGWVGFRLRIPAAEPADGHRRRAAPGNR